MTVDKEAAEPAVRSHAQAEKAVPRFARQARDVRRQMLIEAAIRCLARGGIAAFTVDQISQKPASRAGSSIIISRASKTCCRPSTRQ